MQSKVIDSTSFEPCLEAHRSVWNVDLSSASQLRNYQRHTTKGIHDEWKEYRILFPKTAKPAKSKIEYFWRNPSSRNNTTWPQATPRNLLTNDSQATNANLYETQEEEKVWTYKHQQNRNGPWVLSTAFERSLLSRGREKYVQLSYSNKHMGTVPEPCFFLCMLIF